MKKIFIILIPVLALTLLVSACAKTPAVNQDINTGINSNINQATQKSNFTLTKDPDGWKTYTNYDLGIRFRFEDREDRIQEKTFNDQINLEIDGQTSKRLVNILIFEFEEKKYKDLKDYIVNGRGWIQFDEIRLASVKDIGGDLMGYIVDTEEYRNGKKTIVSRAYISLPKQANKYVFILDLESPIYKQIYSTFEYIKDIE